MQHITPSSGKGFTLVELLITLAIVVIVGTAAFTVLNPVEQFARSRDTQRVADLNQLQLALSTYINATSSPDMDGPNYSQSCSDQSAPRLFASVPSNQGGTAPTMPSGWTLVQATAGTLRTIQGSGWTPLDFTTLTGGSPLPTLPVDPKNTWTDNLFYSYVCKSNGQFELTARMESDINMFGGDQDKTGDDGGDDTYVYEVGSNFDLDPFAPRGSWSMDENTGSQTYDASGNGLTGTLVNSPTWTASCKQSYCLTFADGSSQYVTVSDNDAIDLTATSSMTLTAWVKRNALSNADYYMAKKSTIGTSAGYLFGNNTSTNTLFANIADGSIQFSPAGSTALTANTWYFVALVINRTASTSQFYLNGAADGSSSSIAGLGNASNALSFTIGSGGGTYFGGQIDEVRIYNRPLSAKEIEQMYNALR